MDLEILLFCTLYPAFLPIGENSLLPASGNIAPACGVYVL